MVARHGGWGIRWYGVDDVTGSAMKNRSGTRLAQHTARRQARRPTAGMVVVHDRNVSHRRVRRIAINHRKGNALDRALLHRLCAEITEAPGSIIAVESSGRHFCTGLDTDEIATLKTAAPQLWMLVNLLTTLSCHPRPTVTLVRGIAYGGGVGLALCADAVLCDASAQFRFPGDTWYRPLAAVLVPIVAGRRRVGRRVVQRLFDGPLDAESAAAAGLVDGVLTPNDRRRPLHVAIEELEARGLLSDAPLRPRVTTNVLREMTERFERATDRAYTELLVHRLAHRE